MRAAALITTLLALAGCSQDAATNDRVFCEDAPVVTWDNFGAGFVVENCRSCHHPEATDRQDAPEGVDFVTEDDVFAYQDAVLARAAGPEPTMPPGGGTDGDDRYQLEVWLRCSDQ